MLKVVFSLIPYVQRNFFSNAETVTVQCVPSMYMKHGRMSRLFKPKETKIRDGLLYDIKEREESSSIIVV